MVVVVLVRVTVDVCLMNRYKINVSMTSVYQTDDVLEINRVGFFLVVVMVVVEIVMVVVVAMNLCLMNGHKITVNIISTDQIDDI